MRPQTDRVRGALAYVQRRLGTLFEFTVVEIPDAVYLQTSPSSRGKEDPLSFVVEVGSDTGKLSDRKLLSAALHEVLHALTWPVNEAGLYRLRGKERDAFHDVWEASIYDLERRLAPYVIPFWKRRI